MKIETYRRGNRFTIMVDGLVHLRLNLPDDDELQWQSWAPDDSGNYNYHAIEYYIDGHEILTEYVDVNMWKMVLERLNSHFPSLFGS